MMQEAEIFPPTFLVVEASQDQQNGRRSCKSYLKGTFPLNGFCKLCSLQVKFMRQVNPKVSEFPTCTSLRHSTTCKWGVSLTPLLLCWLIGASMSAAWTLPWATQTSVKKWRIMGDSLQVWSHWPQLTKHESGDVHHKIRFVTKFVLIPSSTGSLQSPEKLLQFQYHCCLLKPGPIGLFC